MLLKWISEVNAKGDVNCDRAVDGRDASVVLTYYALASSGSESDDITGIDSGVCALGDFNGDGKIDACDASAILTKYAASSIH